MWSAGPSGTHGDHQSPSSFIDNSIEAGILLVQVMMLSGPEPTEPKASVSVRLSDRNGSGIGSGPDPTEPKGSVAVDDQYSSIQSLNLGMSDEESNGDQEASSSNDDSRSMDD